MCRALGAVAQRDLAARLQQMRARLAAGCRSARFCLAGTEDMLCSNISGGLAQRCLSLNSGDADKSIDGALPQYEYGSYLPA